MDNIIKLFSKAGFPAAKTRHHLFMFTAIAFLAVALFATPNLVRADATPNPGAETAAKAPADAGDKPMDLEKIGKKMSNPVGDLWMLWFQNDYSTVKGDLLSDDKLVNSTKFQPVMSFPLKIGGQDWNFIVRPVIQYQSMPLDRKVGKLFGNSAGDIAANPGLGEIAENPFGRTTGFGDTILMTLLGPNREDGFIWGLGVTQIFPTAEHDVLGQGKYQAGPAALLANLAPNPGGFNLALIAQHWWSYGGDSDRPDTSMTNIQYIINYRLGKTALLGMMPNITVNWKADSGDKLTFPVGLGISDVIKIGPLPVRIAAEIQYSVFRPDNVGSQWNFRLLFIPVILNPFK